MTDLSRTPAETVRPLAVVTGASSGIGYKLAKLFAEDGHDLMRRPEGSGRLKVVQGFALTGNLNGAPSRLKAFMAAMAIVRSTKSFGSKAALAAA